MTVELAYTTRPARYDDIPGIHALLAAAAAVDGTGFYRTLEDMQREWNDPWSDPATQTYVALAPGGTVAAFGRVLASPEPLAEPRAYLWQEVHPDHRGRGLEDAVLAWAEATGAQRVRALGAQLGDTRPAMLRVSVMDTLHERRARYERFGFRPVRRFYRMRRDLSQPIPEPRLPPGLALRAFSSAHSEAVRLALNEAFAEHWGHEDESPEDWETFLVRSVSFRPDLTPVVFDGGEVAAFSLSRVSEEANARNGLAEGWVDSLGVRAPWRKRGLASALLCWVMRAFKAEGLDYATLGVDTENETGALGLYERLGFTAVETFIHYAKWVDPLP